MELTISIRTPGYCCIRDHIRTPGYCRIRDHIRTPGYCRIRDYCYIFGAAERIRDY